MPSYPRFLHPRLLRAVLLSWFVCGVLCGPGGELPVWGGQAVTVSLRLDRQRATTADSIRMVVTVSGTRDGNLEPKMLGTSGFIVTRGGTSSQIRIVNGEVDASIEHTFFLQAKRSGTYTLGPAEIRADGRTIRSNTVTLEVVEVADRGNDTEGPLFLTAEVSAAQIYVEQPVVYTLRLYRRIRASDLSLTLPETEGLDFKKLGDHTEYETVFGGKRYQVLEVRYRVTALTAGRYSVEPARMHMTVYEQGNRRRQGFFDDPFFSAFPTGRPMTVLGDPVDLNVLDLPAAGRPDGFSGLVGDFNISAGLTPARLTAGESATFTVVVTGHGNVRRIPDLSLPEMAGLKVYADQPVLETEEREAGLFGTKTMKWALVPNEPGAYDIPSVSVSFFDPVRTRYDVLKTLPLTLSVSPGEDGKERIPAVPQGGERMAKTAKEEVKTLARDILPIHTSFKTLEKNGGWDRFPFWVWGILLAPAVGYGMTFVACRIRQRSEQTAGHARSRRAAKEFDRRLGKEGFEAGSCYEALRCYLNDRFDLALGAITPQEAGEILASRGVDAETVDAAKALLQGLEDAIYGGGQGAWGHETSDQARRVVRQIERGLK